MASQSPISPTGTQTRFRSGPFLIHPATGEITRDGIPLKLRPQGFQVLCTLLSRPGELVTREELIRQLWGNETFVDFDQGLNFCIREIRKHLGDDAGEPKYLQTLPRRGYRFIAPVECLTVTSPDANEDSPSVKLATVPELPAAEGVPVQKPKSKMYWVLAASAVLIFAVAAGWLLNARSVRSHYPRRIVVLPFENLTGDTSQEYLVRGVVEEITAQLGAIEPVSIAVIGRTTAEAIATHNYTVGEIGDKLKTDYVVEGSVRREGDKLRITAQLIRTNDMAHVWAESYERDAMHLFTVEQQVASNIVREINLALGRDAKPSMPHRESSNSEAMDAYLRGRDSMRSFLSTISGQSFDTAYLAHYETADHQFQRAIELDPKFALAFAHLASLEASRIKGDFTPDPDWTSAELNANRALQLEPNLPESYVVIGRIALLRSGDLSAARKALTRAYELNPNDPGTLTALVQLHEIEGTVEEGVPLAERLARLDPMDLNSQQTLATAYYFNQDFARAIEITNAIVRQNPNSFTAWMTMLHAQYLRGTDRAWMQTYIHILELVARVQPSEEISGKVLEARRAFQAGGNVFIGYLKGPGKKDFLAHGDRNAAMRYLMLGDKDSALKELDRLSSDERYLRALRTLAHDPMLFPLKGDPRFETFLGRIRAN